MDVEPDLTTAQADQQALQRVLAAVAKGAGLPPLPLHPAAVEAAHRAQAAARRVAAGAAANVDAGAGAGAGAAANTDTAPASVPTPVPVPGSDWAGPPAPAATGPAAWPVELAGPADHPHLLRSLRRALAQLPPRSGADGQPVTAALGPWRAADREALEAAVRLLQGAWPGMLGELRTVVRQVALLDGMAIDGFTDFTVHGAVLINRRRLSAARSGLPGPARLAEALVHEGTHNRCNVAGVRAPFLRPAADDAAGPLATPLRSDPRPLSGLFQQTVVLARCVLLHRRAADGGALPAGAPAAAAAVRARHDRLLTDLATAVTSLSAHRAGLTDHGTRLLHQCAAIARGEA
ncbi:aKG-HExxH-type peptide beta-hydroxylase [Streptomyces sp. URMC 124]|uniref:aKG-HExxH-type peptide beta-hydroxylase n=1 Tax=Streptomyces sp. URMC 124 TaxID=3423405 RepID=UPI003F1CDF61